MVFDIFVWASVAWMLLMVFMMTTHNFQSTLLFKITPFVLSLGLLVFWAAENGFIVNTGAM